MCPEEEIVRKTPRFTPERQNWIRFLHGQPLTLRSAMRLASRQPL